MRKVRFAIVIILFVLPLIFAGCRSKEGSPEYFYREAHVDSVAVEITDSIPPQVNAIINGTLPDACTRIGSVKQDIKNHTFIITITTRRPVEEVCAQTVTPFQVTTPLAVEGLPAGVYTVISNGVTASFELEKGTLIPVQ